MRRKAKTEGRRQIPAMRPRKTHEEKSRALLRAGYEELGSEARRLEREFVRLDAESLKYADEARRYVLGGPEPG